MHKLGKFSVLIIALSLHFLPDYAFSYESCSPDYAFSYESCSPDYVLSHIEKSALILGAVNASSAQSNAGSAHSYLASGNVPIYEPCNDGKSLCLAPDALAKGDYFIAVPQKDGFYCAVYMPKGSVKLNSAAYVKAGDFAETPANDYKILRGGWTSPEDFYEIFAQFEPGKNGNGFALRALAGMRHDINTYQNGTSGAVLKIRPSLFVTNTGDGLFTIAEAWGVLTFKSYGKTTAFSLGRDFDGQYTAAPDCSKVDEVALDEEARSYKAAEPIRLLQICPKGEGLCPADARILKGGYFIAVKRANGLYCAAYIHEGKKKAKAFVGFIKAGNFAEIKPAEYDALLGDWGIYEGPDKAGLEKMTPEQWNSHKPLYTNIEFYDDKGSISVAAAKQALVNDGRDSKGAERYHLSMIDKMTGSVLKIGPASYFALTANGLHYISLKAGKLVVDGNYAAEAASRGADPIFSRTYSDHIKTTYFK